MGPSVPIAFYGLSVHSGLNDLYAQVTQEEQQKLYQEIIHDEETAMLAQYIKEKGKQEGRVEGSYAVMRSLVHNAQNQGFSNEEIAQLVNLDIDSVKKILNNEKIEIPLHLMGDILTGYE